MAEDAVSGASLSINTAGISALLIMSETQKATVSFNQAIVPRRIANRCFSKEVAPWRQQRAQPHGLSRTALRFIARMWYFHRGLWDEDLEEGSVAAIGKFQTNRSIINQ